MRWKVACLGVMGALFAVGAVLTSGGAAYAQDDDPTPTPTPPLASFVETDDDDEAGASSAAPDALPDRTAELPTFDDGVTLIYFWAEWCIYCAEQTPVVDDLSGEFDETLNVVRIDIDDPANRDIVRQYGVRAIPRMILIDRDGVAAHDYLGYTQERRLRQHIRAALLKLSPLADLNTASDFME